MKLALLFIAALLACIQPRPVLAEDLVVVGSGHASVIEGRNIEARGVAMSNALHNALTKAVAKLMNVDSADLTDDQLDQIESKLGASVGEFVMAKLVLSDEPQGNSYRVQLRVTFERDRLNRSLVQAGISQRAHDHFWESIGIVILENLNGQQYAQHTAENAITRNFTEAGFDVRSSEQMDEIRGIEERKQLSRDNWSGAAALGRQHKFEIMIVGEGFADPVPSPRRDTYSERARLDLRMLRTDTGEILAAYGDAASGLGLSPELAAREAYTRVGDKVAQYLLDQLDKRAQQETTGPRRSEVVVTGISYAQYVVLKQKLQDGISGIDKYHMRGFDNDRAQFEVFSHGSAEELADAIVKTNFRSFRLVIDKFSPNRIDMTISRND